MRRSLFALGLILLTTAAMAQDTRTTMRHTHGRGVIQLAVNEQFDGAGNDCSALKVSFDGGRVAVVSQDVPLRGAGSLRITAARRGGIRVTGGDRYSVKLCKAVAPGLNMGEIQVDLRGNELTAIGPDQDAWMAYFLVTVPRGADIALAANNSPISIDSFDGRVAARAQNGPISVRESTGSIDVATQNGPISLSGGSGEVKAAAKNGPLSVTLTGNAWEGNLDASTQNGPLSVNVPRDYASGVVVESRNDGRMALGTGPANVKLSTVNGPLSVNNE